MPFRFTGDFSKLNHWARGFAALDRKGARTMTVAASKAARQITMAQAKAGQTIYGGGYKRSGSYPWPPLRKTGAMLASISVVAKGLAVRWSIGDWKALFHQFGTSRGIAANPMIPSKGRGLPPKVRKAMIESVKRKMSAMLSGAFPGA